MPPREYQFWVYILSNRSHTLYIGMTNNLSRRVQQHREQKPGTHTAHYQIGRLVYFEYYQYVRNAIAREKELKHWTRAQKIVSSGIALSIIAFQFCVGCLVGLFAAWLICRSKLTLRIATTTAVITGIALELGVGAMGWASTFQPSWWTARVSEDYFYLVAAPTLCAATLTALLAKRHGQRKPASKGNA